MIKSYVIRRIIEIKLHSQLTSAITFDDLFNHCELANANRWQKQDVRKIAVGVLENLKSADFIQNFELTKKRRCILRHFHYSLKKSKVWRAHLRGACVIKLRSNAQNACVPLRLTAGTHRA